jgi:hypothetical protein
MILADQHRLDSSRAELNAKNGLSALNCFLGIVSIHGHLLDLKSLRQTYFLGKRQFSFHVIYTHNSDLKLPFQGPRWRSERRWGSGRGRGIEFVSYAFDKVERFRPTLSSASPIAPPPRAFVPSAENSEGGSPFAFSKAASDKSRLESSVDELGWQPTRMIRTKSPQRLFI